MITCEEEDKGNCSSTYCVIFLQQIRSKRMYIRMQANLRVIRQDIKAWDSYSSSVICDCVAECKLLECFAIMRTEWLLDDYLLSCCEGFAWCSVGVSRPSFRPHSCHCNLRLFALHARTVLTLGAAVQIDRVLSRKAMDPSAARGKMASRNFLSSPHR